MRRCNTSLLTACAWVLVLLFLSVTRAEAQKKESSDFANGAQGKAIVAWMKKAEQKGFSGAIIAAKGRKVIAAVGVGFADPDKKVKNTPATLFEIASLSKQVTATAAVHLAQRKKLSLDEPISKRLPNIPKSCEPITLRHLLNMTSGIPGANSNGRGDDVEKVIPSFLKGGPQHAPGSHWEYWNQGYALATEIIARASNKQFVDYCRSALFKPSKMKSTFFTGDKAPKNLVVAIGQSSHGASRSALSHPYGTFGFQYRGMGGVVTTVWDLWRWDRALSKNLLKPPYKKELFRVGQNDYALGWHVRKTRGRLVQSHSGSVRGFLCEGRRFPQQEGCIFVLSNDDSARVMEVANAIEQLLFGEKLTVVLPEKGAAKRSQHLVGDYEFQDGSVLNIKIVGDDVRASVSWTSGSTSRMQIVREGEDFVCMVNADLYPMSVKQDKNGIVTSIELWGRVFNRR